MDYGYEGKSGYLLLYCHFKNDISPRLTTRPFSLKLSPAPRFGNSFFYMQFKILLDGGGVGRRRKGLGAENDGPKGSFKKNNSLN